MDKLSMLEQQIQIILQQIKELDDQIGQSVFALDGIAKGTAKALGSLQHALTKAELRITELESKLTSKTPPRDTSVGKEL